MHKIMFPLDTYLQKERFQSLGRDILFHDFCQEKHSLRPEGSRRKPIDKSSLLQIAKRLRLLLGLQLTQQLQTGILQLDSRWQAELDI